MRKSMLAAIAAISMIGASGAAQAQSASALSLRPALNLQTDLRAGADLDEASNYRGGIIIPTLIIIGLAALIYVLTKDGDPASP